MVTPTALATVKDYIDAGGLPTYYQAEGTGDPLVMLHGGFATVDTFGEFTPLFTNRYRVFSPERRGHGRMPDIPVRSRTRSWPTTRPRSSMRSASDRWTSWAGATAGMSR